jgi:hypothetical protein
MRRSNTGFKRTRCARRLTLSLDAWGFTHAVQVSDFGINSAIGWGARGRSGSGRARRAASQNASGRGRERHLTSSVIVSCRGASSRALEPGRVNRGVRAGNSRCLLLPAVAALSFGAFFLPGSRRCPVGCHSLAHWSFNFGSGPSRLVRAEHSKHLTPRCNGLAALAAELDFVRRPWSCSTNHAPHEVPHE